MTDLGNLFDAYQDGREAEVWEFIHRNDETILGGDRRDEVRSVVGEAARRVRHNSELIVERLEAIGYRWRGALDALEHPELARQYPDRYRASPWWHEHPDVTGRLDEIDALLVEVDRVGSPVPLLLRALLEAGPSLSLAGAAPHWKWLTYMIAKPAEGQEFAISDPLCLPDVSGLEHIVSALEEFGRLREGVWFASSVKGIYSPDPVASAGMSSGCIELWWPQPRVDAVLSLGRTEPNLEPTVVAGDDVYLTDYLNEHFEWGGFPGFALVPDAPMDDIDMLRDGLVRI